ncbi:hypothetical protein E2C01_077877 [Portunus trituberculatus]|uniref:Uncharacterized protein n=1 Tax=Portunus trituberculatus TaxID=210409 RepID=A0A5B7IRA4_PORTR|nr:hypothetical protein [Portunus trituberculatus]
MTGTVQPPVSPAVFSGFVVSSSEDGEVKKFSPGSSVITDLCYECENLAGPCYVFKNHFAPGFVFQLENGDIDKLINITYW